MPTIDKTKRAICPVCKSTPTVLESWVFEFSFLPIDPNRPLTYSRTEAKACRFAIDHALHVVEALCTNGHWIEIVRDSGSPTIVHRPEKDITADAWLKSVNGREYKRVKERSNGPNSREMP